MICSSFIVWFYSVKHVVDVENIIFFSLQLHSNIKRERDRFKCRGNVKRELHTKIAFLLEIQSNQH